MNSDETVELMSVLNNIDKESCLDEYISIAVNKFNDLGLPNFFKDVCINNNISKSNLIKDADIDRTYGYQILNGTKKPSRDKILQLCISANLSFDECNKALKLGNVGELYPKNARDSIIIFCINKGFDVIKVNDFLYSRDFNILGDE